MRGVLVVGLALGLSACGRGGGEARPTAAAVSLAGLPAPYDAADYGNGRKVFNQCRSCHTIEAGAPHLVGPNLHGVFERVVGTAPGYSYSAVVRGAGFQWEPVHLDAWLTDPRGYLPGTKMGFAGVKDATDRRDVIAYLLVETREPAS